MSPIYRVSVGLALCTVLAIAQNTREKRILPVDSSQRQSFEQQPKVAVLAGVGSYTQFSGLTQLRYPAHDVELLEAELTRQGYKVVSLKDNQATRGSIEQALRNASELVDHGSGTVLFFFSGHGFADQGANYLATYEASADDLSGSGLSVKRVEDLLKSTGAPRQVMFIDACRNEAGTKATGARSFATLQGAAGLRGLLSTKAGHTSYEDDTLGSGVFTHFLVEGLRGQAAGQDGLITFRDLSDYVTESVSTHGFKRGQMQVPYEVGEASGDFLLAKALSPKLAVQAAPPTTHESSTPTTQLALPPPVMRDDLSFVGRGCIIRATTLRCTFGITNKATSTRRVWFTEAFFVDENGKQYNHLGLEFASKTNWIDHATDLIPDVPVNLTLEVANLADPVGFVTVRIAYGAYVHEGLYYGNNSTFGTITIKKIPVSR